MYGKSTQTGLTLIELMIAMALGLMISGAVGSVYVQGVRSHTQDERYTYMIENGRYALGRLKDDLQMTDFWGEMLDSTGITTALEPGEDCGIGLFDGTSSVLFNNAHGTPTTLFDVSAGDCGGILGAVAAGTSQLAVKRVTGVGRTTGQTDGIVYLRTNGVAGSFVNDAASTASPAGFSDWRYLPVLYYIRNEGAGPRLCRSSLDGLGLAALSVDECIADGIEQFHLQYGIDTDLDGIANRYLANPTLAQIADAVTVRIYVLARATQPDPFYTNTKSYILGDVVIEAANDNFYRRVFSTTILLRNPANIALLN